MDLPMDANSKLLSNQGELLDYLGRYKRLVDKLNNLTMTQPNVAYHVRVVSQFVSTPRTSH